MLNILGWVIVVWLFASIIYSTQFHLRNYYSSKDGRSVVAKDLDAPGQAIVMDKSTFLRRVLVKQIIKLGAIVFLIYLLM